MAILLMVVAGCLLVAPSFGVIDMAMQGDAERNVRYQKIMDASPIHAVCSVKDCYKPATHEQNYRGYGAAEGGLYAFCDDHWPAPSDGKDLSQKIILNVVENRMVARIECGLGY